MANALRRDILPGEVVVIKADEFDTPYTVEQRLFRADSGFGMGGNTNGNAIYGAFLDQTFYGITDHEDYIRIEGYMIDRAETERVQAENDWALLPVTPPREKVAVAKGEPGRKLGFGIHDLFDRYYTQADVLEDGTYQVRCVVKGKFEFMPMVVDTEDRAAIVMENMQRLVNGKTIMNKIELEEFEAKRAETKEKFKGHVLRY